MASGSTDRQQTNEVKSYKNLAPHKIVLPADLLKDIQDTEAKGCLDNDSSDGFFYIPNFISEAEEEHIISKVCFPRLYNDSIQRTKADKIPPPLLTRQIQSAPQPKWRTLHARRLQNWGGQVTKQALIAEQLPDFLISFPPLIERIRETGAFKGSKHGEPNHCLMNEYEPGQGILPHEDGSAYFPTVATVSLGGHTLLDVYRYASQDAQSDKDKPADFSAKAREQSPRFSILQEPRSLLITQGAGYKFFLHGIAERETDDNKHLSTVTNGDMIADTTIRDTIRKAKEAGDSSNDHSLQRQLRFSLTLRDVERVAPKNLMAMMMGK